MGTKTNAMIKIVFDGNKGKARATAVNLGGWVRFPNKLRQVGKLYEVERLKPGKSGSWIACGEIREVA